MDDSSIQFWSALLGAFIRHALGMIAASLVTVNVLAPTQQLSFVELGTGIVVGLLAFGWSVLNKKWHLESLSGLQGIITTLQQAQRVPPQPPQPPQGKGQ